MESNYGEQQVIPTLKYSNASNRSLFNAPWYVTNETIHRDLNISTVKDEIHKSRSRYNTRVNNHHNPLVSHPTTGHDGPDPQTKKKIPTRLNL